MCSAYKVSSELRLFGVNKKNALSGPVTKYKLLYVSNQGRAGARAWARIRAKG